MLNDPVVRRSGWFIPVPSSDFTYAEIRVAVRSGAETPGPSLVISVHVRQDLAIRGHNYPAWAEIASCEWGGEQSEYLPVGATQAPIPPDIDKQGFRDVLTLLRTATDDAACGIVRRLVQKLVVEPAYWTGQSWLAAVLPFWLKFQVESFARCLTPVAKEVLES